MTVPEKIGLVVDRVKRKFPEVNYQYGHPLEIDETLKSWSGSTTLDSKKYPLIALFQDLPENMKFQPTDGLHIIIATRTQNTYKAEQRYEVSFKPILQPIYEEFIKQLPRGGFMGYTFDHTKIDRLYWGNAGLPLGSNDKNHWSEWIDCIEIQNLILPIYQTINC